MADALVEDATDIDSFGHPRRVWNAVEGMFFVGVSTNQQAPIYNCYREVPATHLVDQLAIRAERSLGELLRGAT